MAIGITNEIFSTKSRFMLLEIDINLNVISKCICMIVSWGVIIEYQYIINPVFRNKIPMHFRHTKMHWNLIPKDRVDYVLILD